MMRAHVGHGLCFKVLVDHVGRSYFLFPGKTLQIPNRVKTVGLAGNEENSAVLIPWSFLSCIRIFSLIVQKIHQRRLVLDLSLGMVGAY